jgi:F-type H+-transporting ATPase subunit b
LTNLATTLVVAQSSGGGSSGGGSGNFLVSPNVGVMVWTLIAFGVTLLILWKVAFPRIGEALDKRRRAIEESIDAAERTRREADAILREYRERLREAREQAEEIVERSRKAAAHVEDEAKQEATEIREQIMAQARRDIETETRRSLDQIRREVADLTVLATERVTRKTLGPEDHERLIKDALDEFDFSRLPVGSASNGGGEE